LIPIIKNSHFSEGVYLEQETKFVVMEKNILTWIISNPLDSHL
jgi:hypothetical protein